MRTWGLNLLNRYENLTIQMFRLKYESHVFLTDRVRFTLLHLCCFLVSSRIRETTGAVHHVPSTLHFCQMLCLNSVFEDLSCKRTVFSDMSRYVLEPLSEVNYIYSLRFGSSGACWSWQVQLSLWENKWRKRVNNSPLQAELIWSESGHYLCDNRTDTATPRRAEPLKHTAESQFIASPSVQVTVWFAMSTQEVQTEFDSEWENLWNYNLKKLHNMGKNTKV